MSINVNRKVTDSFYRYKMPKIIAKIEGRGNGIKTVIVNMTDVSKALGRPPMYPIKYMGCELGAQVAHDSKNDRFIINGAHDCTKLQDLLDGFIEKFVLCKGCENPETYMIVKREKIYMTCTACGETSILTTIHRLVTYVIKNPPPVTGVTGASKINKSKTSKSEKSEETENGDILNGSSNLENSHDDVQWSLDTSENAVKQRMEELCGAVLLMTMSNDEEKSIDQKGKLFSEFLSKFSNNFNNHIKDILFEYDRLELKEIGVFILIKNFFDSDILNQLKNYKNLILKLINNKKKSMLFLLHAIAIVISNNMEILHKSAFILKHLYDDEIVDEDVIIDWSNMTDGCGFISKEIFNEILKSSNVFINWLKTAEEESSDDEDSDEFLNENNISTVKSNDKDLRSNDPTNGRPLRISAVDVEDDIDIENI